jgi:carbon-monoxide dehydrogenase medium subunit
LLHTRDEAKILAGGQSLITLMKLRLASAKTLIDINGVAELKHIREQDGVVVIGALTHYDELANNRLIREKSPLLAEAASVIADQQVRNRGTIGGSLAHADPTADLPTACTALHAIMVAASVNGSRSIESADFFRGYYTTSLEQDEIVCEVRISIPPPRSGGSYLKLSKGHNDFAIVAVASQLTLDGEDVCRTANVVLGGIAPTPVHAKGTEDFLSGRRLDDKTIEEGAEKASDAQSAPSDFRASAEYRLEMAKVLTKQAVRMSAGRANGSA